MRKSNATRVYHAQNLSLRRLIPRSKTTIKRKITQKAKTSFLFQTIFGTSFLLLTSGVFLSGLAILMGADDLLVNYISMITNICGISILFFSSFITRFTSYKKLSITLTILSKLATLLIVIIPLCIPSKAQIAVFITLILIAFTLQAQTTVVINNWLFSFIDGNKSGQYVARRQTFSLVVTVILSFLGGKLLDEFAGAYIGFLILFAIALLMAILEVFTLLRIDDNQQTVAPKQKYSLADMILTPLKNHTFLLYLIYIFIFYISLSIADSYTIVYMIRYLQLPYATTNLLQMFLSLPQIFLLGLWGKISDKKGYKFSLILSITFFIGETLFLALSNSQNYLALIPIAFLFASIGNSGFVVSAFNRRFEIMPKVGRILYDNFYSATVGLAFILGPLIGRGIKNLLESFSFVGYLQFGNIRLLYVFSTILLIALQIVVVIFTTRQRNKTKLATQNDKL